MDTPSDLMFSITFSCLFSRHLFDMTMFKDYFIPFRFRKYLYKCIDVTITGCDGRKYTNDCSEECGYCRNLEWCNHINGTCWNGCERGYRGLRCTEGTKNIAFLYKYL